MQKHFGFVIGTAMQKTIKVRVETIKMHPIVQKPVRWHRNFMAHDEKEVCVIGDYVRIDASKKWSKNKNFELAEIVRPAQRVVDSSGKMLSEPVVIKDIPQQYLKYYKSV